MKKGAHHKLFQSNTGILIFILMLVVASLTNVSKVTAVSTNDYELMRVKRYNYLTGGTLSQEILNDTYVKNSIHETESNALTYWKSMDTSSDRTYLWNDDGYTYSSSSSAYFSNSYQRLKIMALAYKLDGSNLKNNTQLRDDIVAAMDWIYDNWYNPAIISNPPSINNEKTWPGNWFDFQVSSPLKINDIVVLMYDEFSSEQIDNYIDTILHYNTDMEYGGYRGSTAMAGGNLIYKATVFALAGANKGISEPIMEASTKIPEVFEYCTEYPDSTNKSNGDGGFYEDGSFIQHYAHSYSGAYGTALMRLLPSLTSLLDSSPWEITDSRSTNLYNWIYDTFEPLIYKGAMMNMTRGRDISKYASTDYSTGSTLARGFLEIAQTAPADDKVRIEAMVKYWIESNTYQNVRSSANIYQITLIEDLLNNDVPSRGALDMSHSFNMMNQVVHRQSDFALGISMHSQNIENYESTLDENLHGWYTHNGTTYLYNNDLAQFNDNYWPTVNPYRMPGTTVDTRLLGKKENHDKSSSSTWVGGTTYDGSYSVAGMEVNDINSSLTGFKSWFLFDDEVVALGTGITSTDNRDIETIVENRQIKMDMNNNVIVNGNSISLLDQNISTETNVDWVHLEGNVPNSHIGYYFPESSTVNMMKEERQGTWRDISTYVKLISNKVMLPIEDAYVRDGVNADTNYGQENVLIAKDSMTTSYTRNTILKFDLSGIVDADNVKLRIYGHNNENNDPIIVKAYGTTDNSWEEDIITWNNAPDKTSDVLDSITVNNELKYYEWDVTDFAKTQLQNGETLLSIILEGADEENFMFRGYSKEREFYKPELEITVPVYSRSYFNLWFNHGSNPTDESYSYVLLPNKSSEATSAYADNPDIEIISADNDVHAVKEAKLNITGINYLKDNNSKISGIMSSHKSSIIYKEDSSELNMYISDPTKLNTDKITLTMDKTADSVISKDNEITVVQLYPYIILEVDVEGAQGRTFNIKLANPQDVEASIPTEIKLDPIKDAYVRNGEYSDTNYGNSNVLRTKDSPKVNNTRHSYLQFDLSDVDSASKATLNIYGRNSESTKTIKINVSGVEDDSWDEDTITWNNKPTPNTDIESSADIDSTYMYYSFDVTSFVNSNLLADKIVTLMLEGVDKEDDSFYAYSKENSSNIPQLIIVE